MDLQIVGISNKGDEKQEFVMMLASNDCNLHFFAIADTTYRSETTISNKLRHLHWFLDREVKAGDYIFLRTCAGLNSTYVDRDGDTIHELFWGLNSPVWNNAGDGAVLLSLDAWATTRTP